VTEISVVIPAHRAAATLGATLAALERQRGGVEFEVIVSLDGADPEAEREAERSGLDIRIVRSPEPEPSGAGSARNRGAAAAAGRILAFTDADCEPAPDWLAGARSCLTGLDLVQGAVMPPPGAELRPFDRTLFVTRETGLYETANLLVRRELFERLGGFEDWIPSGGRPMGEDVWFGWRARRAGARTGFCPGAVVHHGVFPRTPGEYVLEQRRLAFFPQMARRIPELRAETFYRRYFLSPRTAAFDLAVAGAITAAARRSVVPLLAAAPYLGMLTREGMAPRSLGAAKVGLANVAGDAIGLAALLRGSVAARRPLL
jgi:glycosyltransferase involved in cell wall biosynthesis